jgi:uncharacterized Zn-finger protein
MCSSAFPRKSSFNIHLRSHTGEQPYACSYQLCGRKFSDRGNMKAHYKKHFKEDTKSSISSVKSTLKNSENFNNVNLNFSVE